jgi:hypothetical protein
LKIKSTLKGKWDMNNKKQDWWQGIASYVVDNIFDFVTIIVALYLVVRHEFTPFTINDISDLITWLLAMLGLLAVSELWERHRRIRKIDITVSQTYDLVTRKLGGQVKAEDYFSSEDQKDLKEQLQGAKNVYVVGMILDRAVRDNLSNFEKLTSSGTNLRFILLDHHDKDLMNIMPRRSYGNRSSDWWTNRIQQTVAHIEDIPSNETTGKIEIGYLPYFPSFGMWLIDPDSSNGKIIVEIYHHRSSEKNPTFQLDAVRDFYWFDFFRNQFTLLWDSCCKNDSIVVISDGQKTK